MKPEYGIFGVLAVVGSFAVISTLCVTSTYATQTLDVAMSELPGVIIASKVAIIAVSVFAIIKGGIHLLTSWNERNHIWPDHSGVLPLVKSDEDYVNHTPDAVALIAAIMNGQKPTSAVARDLLRAGLGQFGTDQVNGEWEVVEPDNQPMLALPNVVSVYEAPLPPEPALLIGESEDGQISFNLHNLGSVIVGGLPGYGKSELLASMMAGIMRHYPAGDIVQIAVIDGKRVDFGLLPNDAAIMFAPVAKTAETGVKLVSDVWDETERRFEH